MVEIVVEAQSSCAACLPPCLVERKRGAGGLRKPRMATCIVHLCYLPSAFPGEMERRRRRDTLTNNGRTQLRITVLSAFCLVLVLADCEGLQAPRERAQVRHGDLQHSSARLQVSNAARTSSSRAWRSSVYLSAQAGWVPCLLSSSGNDAAECSELPGQHRH
eukprot:619854-Pelagomonas_calceolata.AAC.1